MSIARDILALLGFSAIMCGTWLIHPAVSLITGGGGLVGVAVWWSWRTRK